MGVYGKKLYIRKSGAVIAHNLYTTHAEAGGNALCLRDGGNILYAALGSTGDVNASPLRVRKGSAVYAVLKSVAVAPPPNPPNPPNPPTPPPTPTPFARIALPAYENVQFITPSGELPKSFNYARIPENTSYMVLVCKSAGCQLAYYAGGNSPAITPGVGSALKIGRSGTAKKGFYGVVADVQINSFIRLYWLNIKGEGSVPTPSAYGAGVFHVTYDSIHFQGNVIPALELEFYA